MSATDELLEQGVGLANQAKDLSNAIAEYALQASAVAEQAADGGHSSFLLMALSIFVLACFVGYYVIWRVTPALHSPLMAITNAISSVVIVGALLAAGAEEAFTFSSLMGFIATLLATINIFGGFIVTRRMLGMFKKGPAQTARTGAKK